LHIEKLKPSESHGVAEKNSEDWFSPKRFMLVLGILLVTSFSQVVAGFETFCYLDFGQFAYPVAFYHRESFWHGQLPFWNPLSNCGVPFLAQWNTMTLCPLSLVYLLLPFPWSLNLFLVLHLFLGGLGMYFLAGRWTGNRFAGALAGAVFAFNGLTWYALMWPHLTAALAWMPWVVLAMDAAWRDGGRRLIPAAVVAALQLLTGGAEVIALTWLLLGALWVGWMWRNKERRMQLACGTLVVALLAFGLAAIQLLSFLDLLAHSQRSASYSDPNLGVMPLTGWANYLVPPFHWSRNLQGLFVPPNHWTGSYFLGMATVLLALLAVWRARARHVWLLAGLTLFSLVMALGRHGLVYDWVTRLFPWLGFMRFPVKFVMLATFTIPLLAGQGMAWWLKTPEDSWPRERNRLLGLGFALIGIVGLLVLVAGTHPVVHDEFASVAGNAIVRILFLGLALACVPALRRVTDIKMQRLLQTLLVVSVWFDVFTHNGNLSPSISLAVLAPDSVRNFYHWGSNISPGVSRIMESRAAFGLGLNAGYQSVKRDAIWRRMAQFFDYNLLDHAPKFDGFYSLDLRQFADIHKRIYFSTNAVEPAKLLDFAAVSLIDSPPNLAQWSERQTCLSLLLAGQAPVFANDPATLETILSDRFDPRRTVYLPLDARGKIQAQAQSTVKLSAPQFTAQRIIVQADAGAPAMLTIAQAYYHNWRAYVDGHPTTLWRANYAFQALEVPAGQHQIVLVYEDKLFVCGAWLSAACVLVCVVGWFRRGTSFLEPVPF
jgi:Bacterial membrane protein YfhO